MDTRNEIAEICDARLKDVTEQIKDFFKKVNSKLYKFYFVIRSDSNEDAIDLIQRHLRAKEQSFVVEEAFALQEFVKSHQQLLLLLQQHQALKAMSMGFDQRKFSDYKQRFADVDLFFIHAIEISSPDTPAKGLLEIILKRILSINIELTDEEIHTLSLLSDVAKPQNYHGFVKLMLRLQQGEVIKVNQGNFVDLFAEGEIIKVFDAKRIPHILDIAKLHHQLNSLSKKVFPITAYAAAYKLGKVVQGSITGDDILMIMIELMKSHTDSFSQLSPRIEELSLLLEKIYSSAAASSFTLANLEFAMKVLQKSKKPLPESPQAVYQTAEMSSLFSFSDIVKVGTFLVEKKSKDLGEIELLEETITAFDTSSEERKLYHMLKPRYREVRTLLLACEQYKNTFSAATIEYKVLSKLIEILQNKEISPELVFNNFLREFENNYFLLKKNSDAAKIFFTCLKTTDIVDLVKINYCLHALEETKQDLKRYFDSYISEQSSKEHGMTFTIYQNIPDPEFYTNQNIRTKFAKENPEFQIRLEQYRAVNELMTTLQKNDVTPSDKVKHFKQKFSEEIPTFKKSNDSIGVKILKLIGRFFPSVLKRIDKTRGEFFTEHISKAFKKRITEPQQKTPSSPKKSST